MTPVVIGERRIASGQPCFIIAEAGVNHDGDLETALLLVDAAQAAGADAVKFQTFQAARLVTAQAPKAAYQKARTDPGESQKAMLERLELDEAAHRVLIERCAARGILFLSSPFDEESVDLLARLGVPAFKIPSGEITNPDLLERIGRHGLPVILSTGMSTLAEVDKALQLLRAAGAGGIVLLQCTSAYPAPPAEINLRAMTTMAGAFALPVGYSDHTTGIEIALAAAALGATVIEKHLTLDRNRPGPDHSASLEPAEFRRMVEGIRSVEASLGDGIKRPSASERETAAVARRSLVTAMEIKAGTLLASGHLVARRPGTGLEPAMRGTLVGRRVLRDLPAGTLLSLDMLA